MTYDANETISNFLAASATKQPTPGGGSAAALAGALAAAMGEMTINYSIGKKSLAQHEPQLRAALSQFSHARAMLLELMVEDQDAYQALTEVKKLPAEDPAKREQPELVKACIGVPQAIGATASAILELTEKVAGIVNPYLLSDLAVCADLAMTTVRCASYNVMVNLPELADDAARTKARESMQVIVNHAKATVQRASSAIWSRQGQ